MQVMLMRLMSKGEYLIVPKGTKFKGSGKLGLIPHLHICSDWLITKKWNNQSCVWATLTKLGIWVVMGTSTTHVVCRHQMGIFNTSFAYLFWMANNKEIKYAIIDMPNVKSDLRSLPIYAPKGSPHCIFCEYSEHASQEPQNSSFSEN